MPLFARSARSILTDSLADLSTNTNLTKLSAGGIARSLLETVSRRLEEEYDTFDLNLARAFISAAPGEYLDLIGVLLALPRESSVAAWTDEDTQVIKFYVSSGTFGDINNSQAITLPQGTTVSTLAGGSGITYRLMSQLVLPANGNVAWASVEATIPGEASNVGSGSLKYHNFTSYTGYANETLLVTNVHPIANGKNLESEANYRYRLANRTTEAEAANEMAIRLAVLSTAGIADAILIPRYRGIGTFGAILKSTTPTVSTSLINSVTANLQKAKGLSSIPHVRAPKETGLEMVITVYYSQRLSDDELEQIETGLEDTIITHVNNLDIGESFLVNRMVAGLFGVSDYITNFGISGKPIDELYLYTESKLGDNRVRGTLLGDYYPATDERIIMEQSVATPITFKRAYVRR